MQNRNKIFCIFSDLQPRVLGSMLSSVRGAAAVSSFKRISPHTSSLLNQSRNCAFWPFAWPKLPGSPTFYHTTWDRDFDPYVEEDNNPEIPRNEFGVPAHIPPEIGQSIKHTYHVPPQYYPFLKKLGDDTPELKPYTDMLINGEMTYEKYEEMFYKFAKPLKIYRSRIPQPYRTDAELAQEDSVAWEGAWYSFRQRILADYYTQFRFRDHCIGALIGLWIAAIMVDQHRQYRVDMKLYYLEAPEHKINWVKPRGDL